jgi:hypothetical protein
MPLARRTEPELNVLGAVHHHILKRLRENKRLVGLDDADAPANNTPLHSTASSVYS